MSRIFVGPLCSSLYEFWVIVNVNIILCRNKNVSTIVEKRRAYDVSH